jgi:hypothetical protein
MLITAFSMYNLKFLLFDTFRPDHLAFPLILLQVYFALSRRFAPLLLVTMLGCQIREFNAVPLLAYMFASVAAGEAPGTKERRRRITAEAVLSIVGLGLALILPRVLIPVSEDFQFASLTRWSASVLLAPFVLAAAGPCSRGCLRSPVLILGGPRNCWRRFPLCQRHAFWKPGARPVSEFPRRNGFRPVLSLPACASVDLARPAVRKAESAPPGRGPDPGIRLQ